MDAWDGTFFGEKKLDFTLELKMCCVWHFFLLDRDSQAFWEGGSLSRRPAGFEKAVPVCLDFTAAANAVIGSFTEFNIINIHIVIRRWPSVVSSFVVFDIPYSNQNMNKFGNCLFIYFGLYKTMIKVI